ncbi:MULTISPECIES: Holliday junction branch migration protein RuvA [Sphingobacterium]|jgi:holliday junction DNA helicase RuvA|uniref:Holliday junction branch migration protein RuvA n=1 Tax=Sphingobacterium thalpophilum TaxID=259 RepID=A0ACD5C8V8_9SPHI|nr:MULTISPECIES: Holliday junction branch migration protein RuvA [Sphingobacterium]KKO92652.1 ATP-dependent DNA helicase RuvA [Sphingobacterium sp. Ag1]MDF2852257.1 Holliday junction branch migration protein RuvA [Sphingobacterium multivorum]MDR3009368.1 Holliday junction branch migration protein RuvA [Sphingobacterium sp.]OFV17647.1 Holliday junction ATP-dependent DNA helicase RuvA [Sphingobacterium sp. HMSC13C05]HAK31201.1 Holliday junction branch migration protein RuvA [Sphingobacterium sp.
MYEYFNGKLAYKAPTHVVIDVSGIGYYVHISLYTFSQIKDQENCKLFISLQVREDSHTLYGFATEGEKKLFENLISVSGIGPNTGRMILSSNTPDEIQSAIVNGQVALIQKIKGIGPKTAQRLILELQDKLKKQGFEALASPIQSQSVPDEALSALVMLGFNKVAAEKVLNTILKTESNLSVEDMIKLALKRL